MSNVVDSQFISGVRDYLQSGEPFYLDLLRQMVAINSFTGNPAGVNELGQLTAAAFAELGFSAETVQSANPNFGRHLVLTRPGRSGRMVALVSHLDTVFPPDEEKTHDFIWRREGDRIYGPGTVDVKGGTVMMYMVLAALKAHAPSVYDDVTWTLLLNASEEVLFGDFNRLCLRSLDGSALACLVFEPGRVVGNRCWVVAARKGIIEYRVTVSGRSAHAGSDHRKGANAITQLAATIQQIASLTDYERELTFNVGTISGGAVTNQVPYGAVATGEMRAFSPAVYEEGMNSLLSLAEGVSVRSVEDGFPCKIDVEITQRVAPWPHNEATERLIALWQKVARPLDMEVLPEERGGLSDGNLLWQHIPTLDGLGPSGANAHCSQRSTDGSKEQEYVLASSFAPKALLNSTAILELLRNKR